MLPDKSKKTVFSGLNQLFPVQKCPKSNQSRVVTVVSGDNAVNECEYDKYVHAENLLAMVSIDEYIDQVLISPLKFPGSGSGDSNGGTLAEVAKEWSNRLMLGSDVGRKAASHIGSDYPIFLSHYMY